MLLGYSFACPQKCWPAILCVHDLAYLKKDAGYVVLFTVVSISSYCILIAAYMQLYRYFL